jgi:hypothetical protein
VLPFYLSPSPRNAFVTEREQDLTSFKETIVSPCILIEVICNEETDMFINLLGKCYPLNLEKTHGYP